jgi:hypothetical protein
MHLQRRIFTTALFGLLALPVVASAQAAPQAKLAPGIWTGTIITPGNQDATNITYSVEYKADTLAITLGVGEHGTFALNEIEVSDTKLKFSFVPGPKVVCVLDSNETGYAGNCTDDEGGVAPLTMVMPAKEAKP